MNHTTLILYAPDDETLAKRLYADLLAAGVLPWAADYDLAPGELWETAVLSALDQSEAVVVLLAKKLLRDPETMALVEKAAGKTLIPVLADIGVKSPWPGEIQLKRRYAEAVKEITERLPKSGDGLPEVPLWQQGNEAYLIGDYEGAVELYKKLENPTPLMLHSRAAAYNALRKHAEALQDIDPALEATTDQALFYRNRSVAYAGLNEHEKALADDEKAIQLDGDDPRNWSSYAMTLMAMSRFEDAEKAIEKASELRPDALGYLYQQGIIRAKSGDAEGALEILNKVLALDPENDDALIWRRIVWGRLGRYEEALAEADRLIKKSPKRGGNYITRSLINFYLERFEEAVKDATAALERSAEHQLAAFYNRAIANWKLNNKEKAQQDLLSAIKIYPAIGTEAGIRGNTESELTCDPGLEILAALKDSGQV